MRHVLPASYPLALDFNRIRRSDFRRLQGGFRQRQISGRSKGNAIAFYRMAFAPIWQFESAIDEQPSLGMADPI